MMISLRITCITLVIHVILKLPQRLRRLEQLPVLVVREMVLDEQCRVGEEVEFIVAGGGKQVSSHVGGAGPGCAEAQGGPQGDFGAFFGLTYPRGGPSHYPVGRGTISDPNVGAADAPSVAASMNRR